MTGPHCFDRRLHTRSLCRVRGNSFFNFTFAPIHFVLANNSICISSSSFIWLRFAIVSQLPAKRVAYARHFFLLFLNSTRSWLWNVCGTLLKRIHSCSGACLPSSQLRSFLNLSPASLSRFTWHRAQLCNQSLVDWPCYTVSLATHFVSSLFPDLLVCLFLIPASLFINSLILS